MPLLNQTHDPARRSFISSANEHDTDFPLQNLPFGVFDLGGGPRCGVAIGDQVLDLRRAQELGLIEEPAVLAPNLNTLLAMGREAASKLRARLFSLLAADSTETSEFAPLLYPASGVTMALPVAIGAFTDFYTSLYHTERGGRAAGRQPPVPPAFRSLPIAYNSRATSVRVSGHPVVRPNGQRPGADGPTFGPTAALDFELELGAFVGSGNTLGQPMPLDRAIDTLWGYCLLYDWSSRDVQRWEMEPLGPFLCKSFCTSISPWIVTEEALRPFRTQAAPRPPGDAALLAYLRSAADQETGGIDLRMEAALRTPAMRAAGTVPFRITQAEFAETYWTFGQMVTHHMSNGCNLQTGDLLGSGTVSGPADSSRACLAELTARGTEPVSLPGGEARTWLEDGDEVIFTARAERKGFVSLGFGSCVGTVLPAVPWPT